MYDTSYTYNIKDFAVSEQSLMFRVYNFMSLGLLVTAVTSYLVLNYFIDYIYMYNSLFIVLFIAQLAIVMYISYAYNKYAPSTALILFMVYSILNGIFLAPVVLLYTAASVSAAFAVTAGMFIVTSLYGYFTKTDLSGFSSLLFMGLIGSILATIINFFVASSTLEWAITYLNVFIFTGLTAYYTQQIKSLALIGDEGNTYNKKLAIVGALSLYIAFIGLFLNILRILGRRRD